MAIYWPTPGFKGRAFQLCVLTRWDFNFCARSSPLRDITQGSRAGEGGGRGVTAVDSNCIVTEQAVSERVKASPMFEDKDVCPLIILYPLATRVVGALHVTSQPVSSIFSCSPVPSGTWPAPGLAIPRCCLPTSSSVWLVSFPLSLCLARRFLARPYLVRSGQTQTRNWT